MAYIHFVFDHCLYFNGTALARVLEREWSEAFEPFGLSPPQAFMLRLVLEKPGILQRQLADALTIARPTATRLLDALEEKRYIERRPGETDRREVEVHPTARALTLARELNAASRRVTRRLQQLLGPDTFETVVTNIRTTLTVLKT